MGDEVGALVADEVGALVADEVGVLVADEVGVLVASCSAGARCCTVFSGCRRSFSDICELHQVLGDTEIEPGQF